MNQTNGYIYVINHPSYDVDDACKMGKVNNIPERDMLVAKLREDILKRCLKFLLKKWELLNAYYKMSFLN